MDFRAPRPFEPQQPCPCCGRPMDGVNWRNAPHACAASSPLNCPHVSHWIGPFGNCPNCTTEEVVTAVLRLHRPTMVLHVE